MTRPLISFAITVGIYGSSLVVANPRQVVFLDGEWRIVFDRADEGRGKEWWKTGALEAQPARTIQVPSCWEEIEQDYEGVAWYQ